MGGSTEFLRAHRIRTSRGSVGMVFEKFLGLAWGEIRTYRTMRELKIKDTRIGALHKVLLISAAFYLSYTIVTSHSYLKKEEPVVTVR